MPSTIVTYLILLFATTCIAQEITSPNAMPRVSPALQECYRRRELFERDNRLPMTPNMLIELIRKVEDSPGFTLNIQQLATSLLHRFKQDGIIPANTGVNINDQDDILQFSANGFNFPKHRVVLGRLIPGNANSFPNASLTIQEQCALHFMLSTSIETQVRGDEGQRCGQLAQYRSVRIPRDTEDVEMMKTPEMASARKRLLQKFGKYQNEDAEAPADDPVDDPEVANDEEAAEGDDLAAEQNTGLVDVASNAISQCPVENGVLQSPWGSFAGGTVMAGVAAGLERQQVMVRDLIGEDHMGQYRSARQSGIAVDNRFAATLSGDIAEAVLRQAPSVIQVGAGGVWNNSAVPRWYFLSQRERLEMTDAEIRGGIDGLVLGTNILQWRDRTQNLRLSQVLDMYFSQRGIFGMTNDETAIRACNRRNLFPDVAPMPRLRDQSFAFTTVLDGEMQNSVTLTPNATARISAQASDALQMYITNTLNDLTCAGTATVPNDDTIWRAATDIYIFVDMSWLFRDIQTMIGHLLNNLDVGRFGSTYTIMNANDGTVVVNTTNQLADLYVRWNQSEHDRHPMGLNLPNVLREMRTHSTNLLNFERAAVSMGGRSLIALVLPQTANVNEEHTNFAVEQLRIFREDIPDLRFIYWAGGSPNRFERFVREPARDLYPLRIDLQGIGGDSIQTVAFPVIHRIQQEPRRIINHRCGANWQAEGQAGNSVSIQFVEPRGISFYRLHPNYFFHSGDNRRIRIHGAGFSSITVCQSRQVERPRQNATNTQQGEVTCQNVNTDTVEINLSNACDGQRMIHHCQPLFISVEGTRVHDGQNLRCTERDCRFPDNARFEIITDNLGCFNSVGKIIASVVLVLASIFATIRF